MPTQTCKSFGVLQTRFYIGADGKEPPGNCFQACLASVLCLTLEEVPDEVDFWKPGMPACSSWPRYWKRVEKFLSDRGKAAVELTLTGNCPWVVNIISGPSPRNSEVTHCIVGFGEELVWDPHPDRLGILSGQHTHMFITVNPSAYTIL